MPATHAFAVASAESVDSMHCSGSSPLRESQVETSYVDAVLFGRRRMRLNVRSADQAPPAVTQSGRTG